MSSRIISQSEVDAFLTCRRKHYYAHGEKITPIQSGTALNRGTIGHAALDAYFTARKAGEGFDAAEAACIAELNSHFNVENVKIVTELTPILHNWFVWARENTAHWKIIAIEKEYRVEVPGQTRNGTTLIFPFKIDLMIEERGNLYVIDNKFVQDFYSSDLITVLPQLAKYVGAMRLLSIPVRDAGYNMIRTRPMVNKPMADKVRSVPANLKDAKIKQYLREQFSAMRQINALKELDGDQWLENYALRTANQFNCRACSFLDICSMDLVEATGRDLHVKTFYKPNEYGYEELTVDGN